MSVFRAYGMSCSSGLQMAREIQTGQWLEGAAADTLHLVSAEHNDETVKFFIKHIKMTAWYMSMTQVPDFWTDADWTNVAVHGKGFPAIADNQDWTPATFDSCYMQGIVWGDLRNAPPSAGMSGAVGVQFSDVPDISKLNLGSDASEPLRPAPLGAT